MKMLNKVIQKLLVNRAPNTKLALIVRSDLKMSRGKTAAQCAHAAIMCYQNAAEGTVEQAATLKWWCRMGQPKIVLRVANYEQLQELQTQAAQANLITALVHDAGRTQLVPGTATVLGLGPAPDKELDKVVAHLKLL